METVEHHQIAHKVSRSQSLASLTLTQSTSLSPLLDRSTFPPPERTPRTHLRPRILYRYPFDWRTIETSASLSHYRNLSSNLPHETDQHRPIRRQACYCARSRCTGTRSTTPLRRRTSRSDDSGRRQRQDQPLLPLSHCPSFARSRPRRLRSTRGAPGKFRDCFTFTSRPSHEDRSPSKRSVSTPRLHLVSHPPVNIGSKLRQPLSASPYVPTGCPAPSHSFRNLRLVR